MWDSKSLFLFYTSDRVTPQMKHLLFMSSRMYFFLSLSSAKVSIMIPETMLEKRSYITTM